ncbi:MAG: hypothetical protein WKF59_26745 [Chitinophagaceae bacterium]
MKRARILCTCFILINSFFLAISSPIRVHRYIIKDSLPSVLPANRADLLESSFRNQALLKFSVHQLPDNLKEWQNYRAELKNKIIEKAGVVIDHKLPLDIKETGSMQLNGYKIKNIAFQTRPGVYATANLYVPDGKGPFPCCNYHAWSLAGWPLIRVFPGYRTNFST